MRGWTHLDIALDSLTYGYPAHAGMDLAEADEAADEAGLPRPCGDGP